MDAQTEREAIIEEVQETACLLRLIESDERLLSNEVNLTGEGHQRLVEDCFLLKVMNCGDEVRLLYGVGKAKSSELGFVIARNCLDEEVSLVGQSGLVIGLNADGMVQVQLPSLNNTIRTSHPNTLFNTSLSHKIPHTLKAPSTGVDFITPDVRGSHKVQQAYNPVNPRLYPAPFDNSTPIAGSSQYPLPRSQQTTTG